LAKDDSHSCIGDVNYSDAGLVNIDDLIESLIEREKDLTMLHVIGIVITQNLRFMALTLENQLMMKLKLKKINLKQFVGKKKN
jgi:hypothetical protein